MLRDVQILRQRGGIYDRDVAAIDFDDAFLAEASECARQCLAGHSELTG